MAPKKIVIPKKQGSFSQRLDERLSGFSLQFGGDRDAIIENLSILVSAGMALGPALEAISKEVGSGAMRRAVLRVKDRVESGSNLSSALVDTRLFPEHMVSLIRLGEESGSLVDNLKIASTQLQKDRALRSKIRSAMIYPGFVMGLTLIIGVGIAWFILPKLALIFSQLDVQLPLITKILIGIGGFLGKYGFAVVPASALTLAILLYVIFFLPRTRSIGQELLFAMPGIRKVIQEIELTRFGYLLGTLLSAGLQVTRALHSLSEEASFPTYRDLYLYLEHELDDGYSFQKSFASYKKVNRLIPIPIQQLIVAGEQSGDLSETLLKIGETYEAKVEVSTKNLTVILEPILLVIVWFGVVGVALAVILPIYSLIGNFKTQ